MPPRQAKRCRIEPSTTATRAVRLDRLCGLQVVEFGGVTDCENEINLAVAPAEGNCAHDLSAQVMSTGRGTLPTRPARSTFGAEADREIADRSKAHDLEFEIEKQTGRPRGG